MAPPEISEIVAPFVLALLVLALTSAVQSLLAPEILGDLLVLV